MEKSTKRLPLKWAETVQEAENENKSIVIPKAAFVALSKRLSGDRQTLNELAKDTCKSPP